MKDLIVTRRIFGDNKIQRLTLRVPDEAHTILEKYNLDIIDYNFLNITIIFANINDEDIESTICFGRNQKSFSESVKKLYLLLKEKNEIHSGV